MLFISFSIFKNFVRCRKLYHFMGSQHRDEVADTDLPSKFFSGLR